MNKGKKGLEVTPSIVIFCLIILMTIFMSCSKGDIKASNSFKNKEGVQDKFLDEIPIKKNVKEDEIDFNSNSLSYEEKDDISNIRNKYIGEYELDDKYVKGSFEITRNSLVFTPNDGNEKEIIHLTDIINVDRKDNPNGSLDILLKFEDNTKQIRNIDEDMFSDILLYTGK